MPAPLTTTLLAVAAIAVAASAPLVGAVACAVAIVIETLLFVASGVT